MPVHPGCLYTLVTLSPLRSTPRSSPASSLGLPCANAAESCHHVTTSPRADAVAVDTALNNARSIQEAIVFERSVSSTPQFGTGRRASNDRRRDGLRRGDTLAGADEAALRS